MLVWQLGILYRPAAAAAIDHSIIKLFSCETFLSQRESCQPAGRPADPPDHLPFNLDGRNFRLGRGRERKACSVFCPTLIAGCTCTVVAQWAMARDCHSPPTKDFAVCTLSPRSLDGDCAIINGIQKRHLDCRFLQVPDTMGNLVRSGIGHSMIVFHCCIFIGHTSTKVTQMCRPS